MGVKHRLKEQISKLLLERGWAPGLDRLEDFVGLFEEERFQRIGRLLPVPGAAAGSAKAGHDLEEPFEENTGGLGHDRFLRVKRLYSTGLRVC